MAWNRYLIKDVNELKAIQTQKFELRLLKDVYVNYVLEIGIWKSAITITLVILEIFSSDSRNNYFRKIFSVFLLD